MTHPPVHVSIPHAYRSLLRRTLLAVQKSTPARYALTTFLRREFRPLTSHRHSLPERMARAAHTSFPRRSLFRLEYFLKRAAREKGLEHRIVRTVSTLEWWEHYTASRPPSEQMQQRWFYGKEYSGTRVLGEVWGAWDRLRADLMSGRGGLGTRHGGKWAEVPKGKLNNKVPYLKNKPLWYGS